MLKILLLIFSFALLTNCENSRQENNNFSGSISKVAKPISDSSSVFFYIPNLKPADGFDYPVGKPDAKGFYNAQGFGKNTHLGDDWNGLGGGNTDLGDPVYAAADGIVFYSDDYRFDWGNIVRIVHRQDEKAEPNYYETFYAHLDTILAKQGTTVRRGQKIGTIGNADGRYAAHLHFELRNSIGMDFGSGYSSETKGFVDPTDFIRKHRPLAKQ